MVSRAIVVSLSANAELIDRFDLEAISPKLDLDKPLPHMVDFFGIKVGVEPR